MIKNNVMNSRAFDCLDKLIKFEYGKEEYILNSYSLTDYLRKMEFNPSRTNCLTILKNNTLILKFISDLTNHYLNDIISGEFFNFTRDLILINLIKAYCISANIKFVNKSFKLKKYEVPLLTKVEEYNLFSLYIQGHHTDYVKELVISRNLKLVSHWAYKYFEMYPDCEIEDLISCGNIGLNKALLNFSLEFNTKFSTYATPKIKKEIRSFILYKNNPIYQPRAFIDFKRLCVKTESILAFELGRYPTIEEIATYLGSPTEEVTLAYQNNYVCISSVQDENNEYLDMLDSLEEEENIDWDLVQVELAQIFDDCNLTETQKKYIYARFVKQLTLEEIADLYGVTYRAVQNSINSAKVKIVKSKYLEQLINYTTIPEEAYKKAEEILMKNRTKANNIKQKKATKN